MNGEVKEVMQMSGDNTYISSAVNLIRPADPAESRRSTKNKIYPFFRGIL